MLKQVTTEILDLSQDAKFVRNLSLTLILAIACIFGLSDIQSRTTEASSAATITNLSQHTTKFIINR